MIDDIDPEKLNTINHIDAAVRTVFSSQNNDEKKQAIKTIADAFASGCVFRIASVSKSISKFTPYDSKHHKIPNF